MNQIVHEVTKSQTQLSNFHFTSFAFIAFAVAFILKMFYKHGLLEQLLSLHLTVFSKNSLLTNME